MGFWPFHSFRILRKLLPDVDAKTHLSGCQDVVSSLNKAVDGLDFAKEETGMKPAKAAFDSAGHGGSMEFR